MFPPNPIGMRVKTRGDIPYREGIILAVFEDEKMVCLLEDETREAFLVLAINTMFFKLGGQPKAFVWQLIFDKAEIWFSPDGPYSSWERLEAEAKAAEYPEKGNLDQTAWFLLDDAIEMAWLKMIDPKGWEERLKKMSSGAPVPEMTHDYSEVDLAARIHQSVQAKVTRIYSQALYNQVARFLDSNDEPIPCDEKLEYHVLIDMMEYINGNKQHSKKGRLDEIEAQADREGWRVE